MRWVMASNDGILPDQAEVETKSINGPLVATPNVTRGEFFLRVVWQKPFTHGGSAVPTQRIANPPMDQAATALRLRRVGPVTQGSPADGPTLGFVPESL